MKDIEAAFAPVFHIPEMVLSSQPYTVTIEKPENVFFNHEAFKNYTNKTIPESVAIILSFGAKFSVPVYYKEEDFNKLKEAAYAVNDAFGHPQDITTIREDIANHTTEYKETQYLNHASEIRDYFTAALEETKHFFKNNNDVIVTQADKANAALIMDRTTYINKIDKLLADKTTYTQLKMSSNAAFQKINKKLLDRMLAKKWITIYAYREALRLETQVANIYALIKTHKAGNAPRPVVNTTSSPGYLAAKKATNILTQKLKKKQMQRNKLEGSHPTHQPSQSTTRYEI